MRIFPWCFNDLIYVQLWIDFHILNQRRKRMKILKFYMKTLFQALVLYTRPNRTWDQARLWSLLCWCTRPSSKQMCTLFSYIFMFSDFIYVSFWRFFSFYHLWFSVETMLFSFDAIVYLHSTIPRFNFPFFFCCRCCCCFAVRPWYIGVVCFVTVKLSWLPFQFQSGFWYDFVHIYFSYPFQFQVEIIVWSLPD